MTQSPHRTFNNVIPLTDRVLKVVMADDDRNDQLLTVMAAEEAGHNIDFQFVDDGSDLIALLSLVTCLEDLPDVIVLDLRMPRLDGHRTLDRLQAHPVIWQIPVLVFTTSARQADMTLSLDLGARRFETKPSAFSGMVAFVNRLVKVGLERHPFEDKDNVLADSAIQASLLETNFGNSIDDMLAEEIDLRYQPRASG